MSGVAAFLLALAIAPSGVGAAAAPARAASATLAEERTYLKAFAGQRENLARFIVANWFEMDRVAMAQSRPLFTHYRLYENARSDGDWDLVVVVGYPVAAGFDDPETQRRFNDIRRAHRVVLVDGKTLAALGSIVRTERVRPREGNG